MAKRFSLPIALLSSLPFLVQVARAEEPHGETHGKPSEEHRAPARAAPPKFQPHPPGAHPHGPVVQQHPVRVMSPVVVTRGHSHWARWNHPEFARPAYYWNWALVHGVTCIAEDSYGDQYPVSLAAFPGFGLVNMTAVEDDALDRCYSESGQDPTCYLATCTHY